MTKPVLVLAYGNPGRGDDILGHALLEQLKQSAVIAQQDIEYVGEFQLQIEHVIDLQGRRLVLLADAAVKLDGAFAWNRVQAAAEHSYTTHAMQPSALLQVYQSVLKHAPPPVYLLSIAARQFALGGELSPQAAENLRQAVRFAEQLLTDPSLALWERMAESRSTASV